MISEELKQRLKDNGQFPYGKRDRAYQSIDGNPGIRDMEHRYEIINFPKSFDGETVIDFGCSAGAICLEAKKRGAKRAVGLDYKDETIQVAKSLAKEMNLDVEFYTFNIDDGLDKLKSLIGEDKFDHVFALSIWAHCDENKLADMINFYTDKLCWFEGHNTITYGDTKSKMDVELERLLDLPYHEHIGETNDRSTRQNYKLSRSLRIDLQSIDDFVYFLGDVYDTVKEANYDYSGKLKGGSHLLNQNSYVDGNYNYNGKYSCYVANSESDFGYKILTFDNTKQFPLENPTVTNLEDKYNYAKRIFDIQSELSSAGLTPKPLEILTCHDSQTFYHAIKMENIKGKFVQPDKEWIERLTLFCDEMGISRDGWSIEKDCVPKNCIEMDGKIYLVDIDCRWVNE
jgi:SAM-dependent methyltransferase